MKKTLALALVAAMTISMASMTAFASVAYNTDPTQAIPEEVTAVVSLTAKEAVKAGAVDAATDGVAVKTKDSEEKAVDGTDETTAENTIYVKKSKLGLKSFDNTATKTFYGWSETAAWSTNDLEKNKDAALGDDDLVKLEWNDTDKVYKSATLRTVGDTATTDDNIATNLKNIEDAKKNGDAADAEKKRLEELDKKYNADGKNAYDAEKKDVEGEATKDPIPFDDTADMNNPYYHACKVAGAPVDAAKTWVYDVSMKAGQKLYDGKNQRVSVELDGVSKDADLSKFGVKVFHIEGWCKATQIKNVDVKGNKVTFWTNSFSPYVVTLGDGAASTGAADASNPSTGDFSAVPVALLAAAALGATGFVAYKKRKAE